MRRISASRRSPCWGIPIRVRERRSNAPTQDRTPQKGCRLGRPAAAMRQDRPPAQSIEWLKLPLSRAPRSSCDRRGGSGGHVVSPTPAAGLRNKARDAAADRGRGVNNSTVISGVTVRSRAIPCLSRAFSPWVARAASTCPNS
jgi:hypothetical protein